MRFVLLKTRPTRPAAVLQLLAPEKEKNEKQKGIKQGKKI